MSLQPVMQGVSCLFPAQRSLPRMSRADIIAIVDRLFLHAYLSRLTRTADPEDGRELDRRLERGMETRNAGRAMRRAGAALSGLAPFSSENPSLRSALAWACDFRAFGAHGDGRHRSAVWRIWLPGDAVSLEVG